ncbi:unnamed protein product [Schistosoma mattheei]|uniref:Uncharacterized protein n=1 Tax=Schistosoma mattheei TaxID=31246 RepID=A0A183NG17_9TREM|nr:unnamed protein product [Schistosoma mattheei]
MIPGGQAHINARDAAVKSIEELANYFKVDLKTGLDHTEAQHRLKLCGPNELKHPNPDPLYKKYLEQFKEPMILLLLSSAFISLIMKQYDDTISITVAILIVVTVAFIQSYRSEKVLEALQKLMPPKCSWIGHHLSRISRLAYERSDKLAINYLKVNILKIFVIKPV